MSIHSAGRFARKLLFAYLLLSGIGINAAILGAIYWDYYHVRSRVIISLEAGNGYSWLES